SRNQALLPVASKATSSSASSVRQNRASAAGDRVKVSKLSVPSAARRQAVKLFVCRSTPTKDMAMLRFVGMRRSPRAWRANAAQEGMNGPARLLYEVTGNPGPQAGRSAAGGGKSPLQGQKP